jgi:hypothetical protein
MAGARAIDPVAVRTAAEKPRERFRIHNAAP